MESVFHLQTSLYGILKERKLNARIKQWNINKVIVRETIPVPDYFIHILELLTKYHIRFQIIRYQYLQKISTSLNTGHLYSTYLYSYPSRL